MTVPLRQSLNSFMKMQLRNHQDIIYLDIVYARKKIDIKKKKKKLYGPFLLMGFNCLKARATLRRQFTFYH